MIGKLLIANEKDKREEQILERRRQNELERRSRIFDPRVRQIGVDLDVLRKQIEEQRRIKDHEKKWEEQFHCQQEKDAQLALFLAEKEKEERRRVEAEVNEYRRQHQRRQDTREYDLNDPQYLKKQTPVRVQGATVSLSSAQKFEGEDLCAEERSYIMAEQRMAWLQQQIAERRRLEDDKAAADEAFIREARAREQRALRLELLENECKRRLEAANAGFNMALAGERRQREAAANEHEQQDNLAEVYNHLTSDMMTENPDAAKSALGSHRTIVQSYRGMSGKEKAKIRQEQMQQILDNKARREQQLRTEAEWDSLTKSLAEHVGFADYETRKKMREHATKLKEENLQLSMQQKERLKYMNKCLYINEPTDDFYNQFNTTTR